MDAFQELFFMQQALSTLFSVTNKLQAAGDQFLKKLTVRQIMVMIAIIHLPEDGATLNRIARKLGTTKQSVKQLVAAMEKKGSLATAPSEKDRRAVNVSITPAGKETIEANCELSLDYFGDVFHEFSAEELKTFWNLLKKLYRFDGKEQDGFEEAVPYGTEDGFSDSQLRAIQKFSERRARDTADQSVIRTERSGHDEKSNKESH
jgi:DNA-binding MarR family transcriptional regulator